MLCTRLALRIRNVVNNSRVISGYLSLVRLEHSNSTSNAENLPGPRTSDPGSLEDASSQLPLRRNRAILDAPLPSSTVPERAEDFLLRQLYASRSLRELLQLTKQNEREIQQHHLFCCVNLVFEMQRCKRSSMDADILHNNNGFISLCRQIRKTAPHFSENELVRTLKMLSLCEVPSDSRVVQSVLNIIKAKVNDFDLRQITYLHFLLTKFKPIPIVEALLMALPIVFETQLETQLEPDNLNQITSMLQYASTYRASPQKILNHLVNFNGEWDTRAAVSTIISLSRFESLEAPHLQLVKTLLSTLQQRVDEIPFTLLVLMLSRLKNCYSKANMDQVPSVWYNDQFLENVIRRALSEKWGLNACEALTKCIIRIGHVNIEYLQHLANEVVRDPRFEEKLSVFRMVRGFGIANLIPANADKFFARVMESSVIKSERNDLPWIRFLLDCAILHFYPKDLLKKILEPSYLSELVREGMQQDLVQLVVLNQALRCEATEYGGPFPEPEILAKAMPKPKESPIGPVLELAMGGKNYVLHKVVSQFGNYIDHVVVLRNGGFPVAVNTQSQEDQEETVRSLESIEVPKDGKMVLVKVHGPDSFAANANRLRGFAALEARCLESLGYSVIHVGLRQWEELQEREKVNYLMRQIVLSEKS